MKPTALVLAALLGVQAVAGEPKRERRRPDLRLVASGAVVLGFFHLLPLALAIRYEEGELALPVLGPLIDLRRCRDCAANAVEQGVVAGLVLDALLQAAGASLLIVGIVRGRSGRVSLAPWFSPSAPGLIVQGRF